MRELKTSHRDKEFCNYIEENKRMILGIPREEKVKVEICDIQGCEEEAVFIDEGDNVYCEDCMLKDCLEEGKVPNDYELLKEVREAMRK